MAAHSDAAFALYLSYSAFLRGEALTVDEYFTVVDAGYDPGMLEEHWADGAYPMEDDIIFGEEEGQED